MRKNPNKPAAMSAKPAPGGGGGGYGGAPPQAGGGGMREANLHHLKWGKKGTLSCVKERQKQCSH